MVWVSCGGGAGGLQRCVAVHTWKGLRGSGVGWSVARSSAETGRSVSKTGVSRSSVAAGDDEKEMRLTAARKSWPWVPDGLAALLAFPPCEGADFSAIAMAAGVIMGIA